MQDYTVLRELSGSIGTVFLVLSFLGFVLYAFRPGSRSVHEDTADIPFRHDDKPASDQDISAAHSKEARQ
ncbi:cytochrome oxidase [Jannaschia sp. EhC01]|uniref:Cbb3-type cytochrome c oxidase subunit 3 n=1 Tax=Gymnodinialimonas phycosphaerae TaxID=2841589 RepID=A0A975YEL7_9RHOB|nr:cbb3-type cytochrome c oxidase subunit 3 [Gymnodinialimonas phycosphaerae]MBY4893719.1 cbb3-type cytochrome c oxidase subunit 3 [Gymnodinialimonas phycosphaerae]OAN76506.1 cytochrome oxidase [Jannaschia sp. EhC01]